MTVSSALYRANNFAPGVYGGRCHNTLPNSGHDVDRVLLGVVGGADATTTGSTYYDDFGRDRTRSPRNLKRTRAPTLPTGPAAGGLLSGERFPCRAAAHRRSSVAAFSVFSAVAPHSVAAGFVVLDCAPVNPCFATRGLGGAGDVSGRPDRCAIQRQARKGLGPHHGLQLGRLPLLLPPGGPRRVPPARFRPGDARMDPALCRRLCNLLLLAVSLLFYFWGESFLIWIVLASTLIDFFAGLLISGGLSTRGDPDPRRADHGPVGNERAWSCRSSRTSPSWGSSSTSTSASRTSTSPARWGSMGRSGSRMSRDRRCRSASASTPSSR